MLHFLCSCSYLFTFLLLSFHWHIRIKSTAYFFESPCTLTYWSDACPAVRQRPWSYCAPQLAVHCSICVTHAPQNIHTRNPTHNLHSHIVIHAHARTHHTTHLMMLIYTKVTHASLSRTNQYDTELYLSKLKTRRRLKNCEIDLAQLEIN